MKFRDTVSEIMSSKPIRDVLQYRDGKLDVTVTSEDLFASVNEDLPSGEIIEYLYDISSSSTEEMRIVLPPSCSLERVKKVYINYLSLAIKRDLREYRTIMIKIISFLLFGVVVLLLSYFLEGLQNRLIADTVNIIGGFAVWEAADVFFFAKSDKKKDILMKLRLLRADWIKESSPEAES